ncbi:MAG: hypothetical protein GC191_17630 [Azospirillum sp.]|nr:hypothetical protein [Azospirillum sp.]
MSLRAVLRGATSPVVIAVAALLLMFEDFVWSMVAAAVARIARLRVIAGLEARAARLGPGWAMALFVVPFAVVAPFHLYGFYLIAIGHAVFGVGIIVAAKLSGTMVLVRLFQVCRPQLMRVRWFARSYYWLVRTKRALYGRLHAMPVWVAVATLVSELRRRIGSALADLRARANLVRARGLLTLARLRAARGGWGIGLFHGPVPGPGE